MLSRDRAFDNNIEKSTNHCKTDQVANRTYSLPLTMTEKRGNLYEDICSSAHLFLAKDTCTTQKIRMIILEV